MLFHIHYRKFLSDLCDQSEINHYLGQLITFRVYDMTFQGHEFLEKIRSDTVWNQKLKPVFTTIGSMSLEVISSVANSAITSLVLAKLGL